jgi:predicted peptidase
MDYLLHLPGGYEDQPDALWPLILFLHGAGERGDDLEAVARHGIPREALRRPGLLPFVAISPQCPAGAIWDDLVDELLTLLTAVESQLRVDLARVYLTGLSMGGYGAWHLACLQPTRFAALAPVCGVSRCGAIARVAVLKECWCGHFTGLSTRWSRWTSHGGW